MSTPARLHVILARRGASAVVFRRGPSNKVAVLGWDRDKDEFTLGQWFRGHIYPRRSDLSPNGNFLIYFAAKYGRESPVDKRISEEMEKHFGQKTWRIPTDQWRSFRKELQTRLAEEFRQMTRDRDYSDRSWTAISRAPYLKALSLWWNGTGWNGGGLFLNDRDFCLNRPPEWIAPTLPGTVSGRFRELPPGDDLVREAGWGCCQGECPQVYFPRLIRDGWREVPGDDAVEWAVFEKPLPRGLVLRKSCPQAPHGNRDVYWETHRLLDKDGSLLRDGADWEWADCDAHRRRIVYAEKGALYAVDPKTPDRSTMLHDFNDMRFRRTSAPY